MLLIGGRQALLLTVLYIHDKKWESDSLLCTLDPLHLLNAQ